MPTNSLNPKCVSGLRIPKMAGVNGRGADQYVPWWQRPVLQVKTGAEVLGCSPTQIYKLAGEGRLVMKRLAGRVVVETQGIVLLLEAAEAWTPSTRGEAGRRKRAELAAQRWR